MKAIGLISGGLDSSLAVKLVQQQGIDVVAVHFLIPFVKWNEKTIYDSSVKKITQQLNCKLRVEVLAQSYLDMLLAPAHGYGKNFNPCIDCKILMLKNTKKIMQEEGADFIFTGEVIGQRPMSQKKPQLKLIEKESGLEGLLLRPLSAKFLEETIPEQKGWLKKENLFDLEGRARSRQLALAKKWKIEEFPWPSGGCLLTESDFCKRLKDLVSHGKINVNDIYLLKAGRYFRVNANCWFVVGRDHLDNLQIEELVGNKDCIFKAIGIAGPLAVARGEITQEEKKVCAQIVARYTKAVGPIKIEIRENNNKQILEIEPLTKQEAMHFLIS